MSKDTTGHKKGDFEADNWRTQRRSNKASSPKKLTEGTSRGSSSSSLSSSSSNGNRRETGNGSSSSSASSSKVSSSTTSVSKSAPKESHQDCSSSRSHSHVSNGDSHIRRNKRIRTKSNVSPRKHREEATVKTTSLDASRRSPSSNASSSRRRGDDDKSKRRHDPKGNRADEDSSWRRRSPTTGTSSTKESHHSSRDRRERRCGCGQMTQTDSRSKVHVHVDKESGDTHPKEHPREENVYSNGQDEEVEGSEENFDFASDIFKDGERKCQKSIQSTQSTKTDIKTDARSLRLLKISDERRKKEYVGYQPIYVHKLYSYGIDNKGKKEPQKTDLSKKEEDTMFRKRAVYMMHVEEERKREEHEEKKIERSDTLTSPQTNVNDVSEKLKEAVKRKNSVYNLQRKIDERRDTMAKETNRLLQDMEAALPDACEMDTISESMDEGGCSSDHDSTDQTKHKFAEALNLRTISDKPDNSKSSSSSMNTHVEYDGMATNSNQISEHRDFKKVQQEKDKHDATPLISDEMNVSSHCDDTYKESTNGHMTSNHDADSMEKETCIEGDSTGPAATNEGIADAKTIDERREGDLTGRHCGLPPIISDIHCRDNGKVLAASKKDNVIRISPEAICLEERDSSSDKVINGTKEKLEVSSSVETSTSTKDKSTTTGQRQEDFLGSDIDMNPSSSGTQKKEEIKTINPELAISNGNTLPEHHVTSKRGQASAPTVSVKNGVNGPGSSKSLRETQSQQYTRIAPAKTVRGNPTYVLPPASTYVGAPLQQALGSTSPSQVRPKGNVLPVLGNQNQSMFQANGNIYLQKMSNILDVTSPTIQLSHGNRPFASQVNNAACLSVPPLVVLPNNTLPGVPSHQAAYGFMNFDGSAVAGAGGISNGFAARNASQPADQILYLDQRCTAIINNQSSVLKTSASVDFQQSTKSEQNEISRGPSRSQGLLGYINVPVIKDDQGRLVMVLPNDKTIMGSTQIQKEGVGKVVLKDGEAFPTNSAVHRDVAQSKPLLGSEMKPDVSRHQHPHGLQTENRKAQNTIQVKNDNRVAAHPSSVCTNDVSSQVTECKSGKPEHNLKSTNADKHISNVPSVTTNDNDEPGVKQRMGDEGGKSTQITSKKPLENPDVASKNGDSFQSKSVDELRIRQRAITAKLKELRSVRVLIAKHGRMEEVECVRMVERLKQVEDLFFRQLIASSKELGNRLKSGQQVNQMDARETEGGAIAGLSARSKLKKDCNQALLSRSNMTTSKTGDSKGKRSDETVDKLLNTAHLLRNCISAMSKKKHARRGKRAENASVGNKELDIHVHVQHGKISTHVERKSKVESKKQDLETSRDQNTHIHNASSTSTVSTEQESDMSIGSPQVDQYHLQPHNSHADASTDKIVLRLHRVRNSDDTSSTSTEDAKSAKSPVRGNGTVEKDEAPPLRKVPLMNSVTKTVANGRVSVDDSSNQSRKAAQIYNDNKCSSQVTMAGRSVDCNKHSKNDRGAFCYSKACTSDNSSSGSISQGMSSGFSEKHTSTKDKRYAVFTGPTKEQIREEEMREREMVKEAWNRVFPSTSSSQIRDPCRSREDLNSSDSEPHRPTGQALQAGSKDNNKEVKHVYGNPVIRGNLASIGNINVTRQVGGSSETKFQWLLKQLQKKRNGESQWKQNDQLRMSPSIETRGEDGREYVSLISRGVQTRNSRMEDSGNASTSRKVKVGEQEKTTDNKENDVISASLQASHNHSVGNQNGNTKKRGRESTGSEGKPQEKLPRIRSPTSDREGNVSTGFTDENDDLQDLISLREEVLSRQSSSSEDTVEYSDSLICVEENVRRLKPTEKEKKKLKSTGTMTASEPLMNDTLSMRHNKSSVGRKFATKTRGHGTYGWCKKKIASKISKSKGTKKRTTASKTKAKAKTTSTKKNTVILISDESLLEQSEEESPEKEKVTQKGRRNTLASLSARLWDECYWSTINDTSNPALGTAKSILPSNNSPPTTRRTGLESKMLGLWSDLLRYSGNHLDVDSLPATLEDLDRMDLPLPLANSMKILLEGYNMVKQGSSFAPDQDSKSSTHAQNDTTLNENNCAGIHVIQHNESAQIPWEEPSAEETEDLADTSPSDDQESHASSSTWEASRSTEFTLHTLTSHSANTVGSVPSYHSSSTTASPPSLSTEDGYVPVELPDTNLRRWQTRMQLATGTDGNGLTSPDYSADIMNRNDTHEEGDSGRSGSERADGMAVGTSGWQISGAGDLREPRLVTEPKATARNRRRQNRVMSWPNIVHEEEDSEDDIPLAKLIEKERLKIFQRETAQDHQPLNTPPTIDDTNGLDREVIQSSPESELPGPFLLGQSRLSDISTDSRILDTIPEEKQNATIEERQRNPMDSHPHMEQSEEIPPERLEEHRATNHSSAPLKKSGKFLYGNSKKGKALVKKRDRTPHEIDQLSSRSNVAGAMVCGRRFVVSCSPTTDNVGNGNHLYYRSDSSPDIFD